MNATFIHPTSQAGGIPTAMPEDNSHPVKVFVAFDEDGCATMAEVLIHRVTGTVWGSILTSAWLTVT